MFGQPGIRVQHLLGHRLLDHHDSVFLEPEDHIQGLLLVLPALVGIYCDREVRYLPDSLDHFLVVVQSDLDFQDVELVRALPGLLPYHFRSVDPDGECGVWRFLRAEAPYPVPRLAHHLSHQVVEGDVHRGLRCGVSLTEAVHIFQDLIDPERVAELLEVDFLQEGRHALDALAEIRRHRSFPVACQSVVFDPDLHVRRGCPGIRCHGEGVAQLQGVWLEAQLHLSAVSFAGADLPGAAG